MYDGNQLPMTGAASIAIGGIVLDQVELVAVAGGLVALGAVLVRVAWRPGKAVSDQ